MLHTSRQSHTHTHVLNISCVTFNTTPIIWESTRDGERNITTHSERQWRQKWRVKECVCVHMSVCVSQFKHNLTQLSLPSFKRVRSEQVGKIILLGLNATYISAQHQKNILMHQEMKTYFMHVFLFNCAIISMTFKHYYSVYCSARNVKITPKVRFWKQIFGKASRIITIPHVYLHWRADRGTSSERACRVLLDLAWMTLF